MTSRTPATSIFAVTLDSPSGSFSPGETVTGTVTLSPPDAVTHIALCLSGRAKTKVWKSHGNGGYHIYRGRHQLLNMQLIEANWWDDVDGARRWRFGFTLPPRPQSQAELAILSGPAGSHCWHTFAPGASFREEYLPPTFDHNYVGLGNRFEAYVSYAIGARLIR